jgi:hypothetical protein
MFWDNRFLVSFDKYIILYIFRFINLSYPIMWLSRKEIIDIAISSAEKQLNAGNVKLSKEIINRATKVLVHRGHPAPVWWQIEIMSKLNSQPRASNIGIIAHVDPSLTWMTLALIMLSRSWKGHLGNNTKH